MEEPPPQAPEAPASEPARPVLAYVIHSLQPGGTEQLAIEMGLAFSREYRVVVFCLDEPGAWVGRLRSRAIPVYCLWRQPGFDLFLVQRLARALRACQAQIVHAHQCTPWFYAALSRLLYRAPRLVLEEHGRFFPEADRPARRLVNRLLIRRLTHRFVAVSEDVRRRLQRYEGLRAADIQVIYNGVAAEPALSPGARVALRRELGLPEESFLVGTVGRLDPIKNLPLLIRSLAAARAHAPGLQGVLIGDGPEAGAIRALVSRLGLQEHVRLTGHRNDARTLIQCLDLFVLPSFSEGTSVALLEAMAASVAVAVTAVGGNVEIVQAGESGWVVSSDDTAALTAALLEAFREPVRRRRYAEAARARFEERFAFPRMIDRYRQLYAALLPLPAGAQLSP